MKERIEELVHNTSMKAYQLGAALMPYRWPKVYEGGSPISDLCELIIAKGHKSVFLITSQSPLKLGFVEPLIQNLQRAGVLVTVYDEVRPDPTVEEIESAVVKLKQQCCDAVIAFGGGSVIDAAKVVSARAKNKKSTLNMSGLLQVSKGMLPLFVIPTTAGTGSEVTIAAVVTDTKKRRKVALIDPRLMPTAVALDGALMRTVPPDITAATGMDALTHAVEAFISGNASAGSDAYALEAVRIIMANLTVAVSDGENIAARKSLARAAHLAGKAFTQAGVGYVHAIAHGFGALYHIPHGRANAIVMPHVLEYSLPKCEKRLALLARECGLCVSAQQTPPN